MRMRECSLGGGGLPIDIKSARGFGILQMLSGTDYPLIGVGRRARNMAGLHVRTGLVVLLLTLSEGKSPINICSIDAVAINVA